MGTFDSLDRRPDDSTATGTDVEAVNSNRRLPSTRGATTRSFD